MNEGSSLLGDVEIGQRYTVSDQGGGRGGSASGRNDVVSSASTTAAAVTDASDGTSLLSVGFLSIHEAYDLVLCRFLDEAYLYCVLCVYRCGTSHRMRRLQYRQALARRVGIFTCGG